MTAIFNTDIPGLELIGRGKVRDIYAAGDEHLLIVATDRLSAFDVVLPDPIPGKGAVLTGLSRFWFSRIDGIVRNHCTEVGIEDFVTGRRAAGVDRRSGHAPCRRLQPLPIEAIVRGYLIGSGWKDYQRTGTVCGIRLPSGLRQADKLPEVIFTPFEPRPRPERTTRTSTSMPRRSWSAGSWPSGCGTRVSGCIGRRRISRRARGIIIADTKFEFALDADG